MLPSFRLKTHSGTLDGVGILDRLCSVAQRMDETFDENWLSDGRWMHNSQFVENGQVYSELVSTSLQSLGIPHFLEPNKYAPIFGRLEQYNAARGECDPDSIKRSLIAMGRANVIEKMIEVPNSRFIISHYWLFDPWNNYEKYYCPENDRSSPLTSLLGLYYSSRGYRSEQTVQNQIKNALRTSIFKDATIIGTGRFEHDLYAYKNRYVTMRRDVRVKSDNTELSGWLSLLWAIGIWDVEKPTCLDFFKVEKNSSGSQLLIKSS